MSLSKYDMNELRRISTNTYDDDKACINRVIKAIVDLENQVRMLKLENEELKKKI